MSDSESRGESAIASRSWLLLAALAIGLLATGLSNAIISFSLWSALPRLALALAQLAGMGFSISLLLGLRRPPVLAGAFYILLGQLAALAYLYVRSTVSDLTGQHRPNQD